MADSRKETVLRLLAQMAGEPYRQPVVQQRGLIDKLLPEGSMLLLNLEELNKLLLYLGFRRVTDSFFNYFFPQGIPSLEVLEQGVDKVRKTSMLYFGNFVAGFQELASQTNVEQFIDKGRKVPNLNKMPPRLDAMAEIESLTPEQAYALGYVTQSQISQGELKEAETIAITNAEKYLAMHPVDVYVAASMRDIHSFKDTDTFLKRVFTNEKIKSMGLRYFNPLISYFTDSTQKGLLESLMLKKASVMLYVAGSSETFGKDVELAAMLVQGKPVIAYTNKRFRRIARMLRESHPLRLQVELTTGVAHGLIVVDSAEVCAEILHDLFTDSLETYIEEDDYNYYLYEKRTGSQIRVVTKNAYLANAFWDFFR